MTRWAFLDEETGDWIEVAARLADGLDAVWAEAEAALPKGGYIWAEGPYDGTTDVDGNRTILGYKVHAWREEQVPYRHVKGYGTAEAPTLAAALRALTAKLRERPA